MFTFLPFQSPVSLMLSIVLSCGVLALLVAAIFRILVGMKNAGTKKMQDVAAQVRSGVMAFLWREYIVIVVFLCVIGSLLFLFLDTTWAGMQTGSWKPPYIAGSFVLGALCSIFSGFIGIRAATSANVRATQAARTSLGKSLRVAFLGGATTGLSVVGLAIIGLTGSILYFTEVASVSFIQALSILAGFSFGASSVALFTRVGGGIYAKAADVGAGFFGKVEVGTPKDESCNPAVVADYVGNNVGGVAGIGADLFESYVGSLVAAMLIGGTVDWGTAPQAAEAAILFPLVISAFGIIASIISTFVVRTKEGSGDVHDALKNGLFLASALVVVFAFFFAKKMLPAQVWWGVFLALTAGLVAGVIIRMLTEYYTSSKYTPVKELASAAKAGSATTITDGLALGYISTFLPLLFLCAAIGIAYSQAGLYGIAVSAVGMLSTLGISLAIDAYCPIVSNAGGFADMAQLTKQVRERIDMLESAGGTSAAIGNGFAIGSAALTALALFTAFSEGAALSVINLMNPLALIGLLIGGALPYVFAALTMRAVGHAASVMVGEVRRQCKETKGSVSGRMQGEGTRCVGVAAGAAMYATMFPGFIAIAIPVAAGFLFGSEALGGLLVGSLVSGALLALSMMHSGGAWNNARKYIEAGNLGGKGSESHKATLVGNTVGSFFKDASGPSVSAFLKLMTIVSLLTVGFYSVNGLLG